MQSTIGLAYLLEGYQLLNEGGNVENRYGYQSLTNCLSSVLNMAMLTTD